MRPLKLEVEGFTSFREKLAHRHTVLIVLREQRQEALSVGRLGITVPLGTGRKLDKGGQDIDKRAIRLDAPGLRDARPRHDQRHAR